MSHTGHQSYSGHYHHYYGSPLLDELHNYFPAILYEPSRFTSVASLMSYIQTKMRERFDLFSHAQAAYQQSPEYTRFPPMGPNTVIRQPPRQQRQTEQVNITMETEGGDGLDLVNTLLGLTRPLAPIPTNIPTRRLPTAIAATPLQRGDPFGLLNLLNMNLLTAGAAGAGAGVGLGPMEPVIVRPTLGQIDIGTTLEVLDAEEEVCAICQDNMNVGEEVRVINACDHRFHRNCIDTWFQRNVRCPVCRHDIREPAAAETDDGVDSE